MCNSCRASIPRLHSSHPIFCQTRDRLVDSEVIADLVSVFLFEKGGAFQSLAHALKYDGFESVGIRIGRELGDLVLRFRIAADVLIPIPLHRVKFRERGFNQAEAIAKGVSEITGIPVRADILCRVRYTQTQTKLDQEQRKKNVEEAFSVSRASHGTAGGTVILVDDVITTGATIVAAAQTLRTGGFGKVIAASLALAE